MRGIRFNRNMKKNRNNRYKPFSLRAFRGQEFGSCKCHSLPESSLISPRYAWDSNRCDRAFPGPRTSFGRPTKSPQQHQKPWLRNHGLQEDSVEIAPQNRNRPCGFGCVYSPLADGPARSGSCGVGIVSIRRRFRAAATSPELVAGALSITKTCGATPSGLRRPKEL